MLGQRGLCFMVMVPSCRGGVLRYSMAHCIPMLVWCVAVTLSTRDKLMFVEVVRCWFRLVQRMGEGGYPKFIPEFRGEQHENIPSRGTELTHLLVK